MGGLASASCQAPLPQAILLKEEINIFPDYRGVTIPYNIAPLNFRLQTAEPAILLLVCKNEQIRIDNDEGRFQIPVKAWKRLTSIARGEEIQATIYLKRDTQVEKDRHANAGTTDIFTNKHYGVALTNTSKVVLAKFKK